MNKRQEMSENEDELIPDEFSDGDVDDVEEFVSNEEEFEARQSISSRGSIGRDRNTKNEIEKGKRINPRDTGYYRPQQNRQQREDYEYAQGSPQAAYAEGENEEEEGSVQIEVVEIEDSINQDQNQLENSGEREQRIQEYLDVDKDDYIFRDQYDVGADGNVENSGEWQQQRLTNLEEKNDNRYLVKAYGQNKYGSNSPIQENLTEDDRTASPGNKLNGSRGVQRFFNDKSHLIWEREKIERKRLEWERKNDPLTLHHYFKDPSPGFSTSITRGKLMPFDFTKQNTTSRKLIDSLKSSIPLLSDHYQGSKTHQAAAQNKVYDMYATAAQDLQKQFGLSNIFNQSEYQSRLEHKRNVKAEKVPTSHSSLNKTVMDFNTAKYNTMQAVSEGRQRMFHSSQVF